MIGTSTRLMLVLMLFAAPVRAEDGCTVPMTDWQPRSAVVTLAAEMGWQVRRIRIDDGCYKVIGRDAQGRAIEVRLNPATLEVIETEYEDDRERGSRDGRTHRDGSGQWPGPDQTTPQDTGETE